MTNEEWMQAYIDSDEDALSKLYEQNMHLIWDIAKKCIHKFGGIEDTKRYQDVCEELYSEGTLEFMEVVSKKEYDQSKGKFTTYIYPFLKGAMYRWLEKDASVMGISRASVATVREVRKQYYEYGIPTSEIARILKISEEQVAKHLAQSHRPIHISDVEQEQEFSIENQAVLDGIIIDNDPVESVENTVMTRIWLEKLLDVFDLLAKRDQILLGEFYGVYGNEKKSVSELALDMELTIDGVYKARDAALERMKKIYRKSELYIWRRAYVDTKITALKGK